MRPANAQLLYSIYATVKQHPGIHPAQIARRLNLPRSQVTRNLPNMERHRLLLWEDASGKLYPFIG